MISICRWPYAQLLKHRSNVQHRFPRKSFMEWGAQTVKVQCLGKLLICTSMSHLSQNPLVEACAKLDLWIWLRVVEIRITDISAQNVSRFRWESCYLNCKPTIDSLARSSSTAGAHARKLMVGCFLKCQVLRKHQRPPPTTMNHHQPP